MQQRKITYFIKNNKTTETFDSTGGVVKRLWEILMATTGDDGKKRSKSAWVTDMLDLGFPNDDYGMFQYMVARGVSAGVMRGNKPIPCDIFSETKFRSNDGYGD